MTYTYETMKINNSNANTRAFVNSVAAYLQKVNDVVDLRLFVDNKQYTYTSDTMNKTELQSVCKTLSQHKKIKLSLRVIDGYSFGWKLDESFLGLLNEKIQKYVTYKATEYSDDDSAVNLCVFDAGGLRYPNEYSEEVPDIEKWYCRTPEITISVENEADNQELYSALKEKLDKLKKYCDAVQLYEDEWKSCGTFEFMVSIAFYTKDIPKIIAIFQSIKEAVEQYNSGEFNMMLCGVPDGEKDYDFAAVKISADEAVKAEYIKF